MAECPAHFWLCKIREIIGWLKRRIRRARLGAAPTKSVSLADRDVAPPVRGLIDAADKLAKGAD
jgi:hypothetical protein